MAFVFIIPLSALSGFYTLLKFCFFILRFQDVTIILSLKDASMVAYFCHHLSDNYVDLSDRYVVLSDIYVDLSDLYVDLSLIHF